MLVYANGTNDSYPRTGTTWYNTSTGATGVYEATLFNSPTFNEQNGGYFTFDGVDEYARFSSGSEGNSNSGFTMGIWVKTTSDNTEKTFLVRNDVSTSWSVAIKKRSNNKFGVSLRSQAATMEITGSTVTLVDNVWYYVVVTYDKETTRLYVNAQLEGSAVTGSLNGNVISPLKDDVQGWTIGRFNGTYYNFSIGAVEIYQSLLTNIQINQNFDLNRNIYGL
jgi:hypothetical protein